MTQEQKTPSPELLSLIKAAAQSLLGFGELWGAIKQKGADEGFKETDLQDMLRPLLRDRLGMSKDKIYYLFHQEQEKEKSKSRRYFATINVDKVIEQTPIPEELPPEAPTKTSEEFYKEEEEEPTELELLKIENEQLKDALKKMDNFKPATALEQLPKVIDQAVATYENAIDYLRNGADGIGSFYYDTYGIDLFKNRELAQLKNSGVKTFRRLYFEV